jgi:sodium/proline symporter
MPRDQLLITITFVAYVLVLLAIGWRAHARMRDLSDYILGGRRLGRWVTALSAGASDMSGWLLLGLPGYAYAAGYEAWWLAAGLAVGTYANWRLVARPLRHQSHALGDALTLPAYLENRFADRSRALRLLAAAFILLFFLFYTASGLVAGGKLFEQVFGMPYLWAVSTGTVVIILYTLLGGFIAVSWTDLFQALLMVAALIIVPLVSISVQGGVDSALAQVRTQNPALLDIFTGAGGEPLGLVAILSLLAWGLGYFGQPHILARFMAISDHAQLGAARRIAITWTILGLLGATLGGLSGIGLLQPPLLGPDTEKVFIVLVSQLFHPLIAGVLLAAILAAIMSTADSQLLVSASALAEDFYRGLLGRETDDKTMIRVGRIAVVVIAVLAFSVSLNPDSMVLDLVAYAWAGFGAAFGPTILLSLYWSRMTRNGALAGMLTGGLTVVIWKQLEGGIFELYELLPGFLLSMLAIALVSTLGAPRRLEQD